MKEKMSGPIGIAAIAVVVLILVVGGYFLFLKEPGRVSPEETKKHMMGSGGTGGTPGGGPPRNGPPQRR